MAEQAGRNVKKSLLELGGSDPFVVLDGERLERTVDAAAKGRLSNTGQSCVASKRFIVLDGCYDAFLSGLRDRFAALEPGDPADPETQLGPLSSERAATALMEQVADAVEKGATVSWAAGGRIGPAPSSTDDPHRRHARDAGVPRGAVRTRGGGLPGYRRG